MENIRKYSTHYQDPHSKTEEFILFLNIGFKA